MMKVARCPSQYSSSNGSDTISRLCDRHSRSFDSAAGVEIIETMSSSQSSSGCCGRRSSASGGDMSGASGGSNGGGSGNDNIDTGKQHRIRTVRLIRPNNTSTITRINCHSGSGGQRLAAANNSGVLGFSIRGGREHGTGFFVSAVQAGSEAERQGLKVGDQIIRINGFTVEDAIHKEVLQLISNHKHIHLKVRHVGMIPVKEKNSDSLGWQIIDDSNSMKRSSPSSQRDIRINIVVTPKTKLDCGICKGPDWKPGIFVQFTKEGGIAHDVGLRPGDQILQCNNIDFNGVTFNDAVHILKTSKHLELVVRQGAGFDLITAESSGYNSSASSVTGDQSPSSTDSKRLSIVKEENQDLEDRLSRSKVKKWNNSDWNSDPILRNCKPTIITLTGTETTIQNNGSVEVCQSTTTPNQAATMHTVVAQIHRTDDEGKLPKSGLGNDHVEKRTSMSCPPPPPPPISLSTAISQELKRRTERKLNQQNGTKEINKDDNQPRKPFVDTNGLSNKKQHDILMDEFRRAHSKMFSANNDVENTASTLLSTIKRSNKPKAPPVPKKTYNEKPACPQPDYDPANDNDIVEMESLASFQLNNPSGPEPKPPNTYFNKPKQKLSGQSSISSATSIESIATQKKRPVSVTFSEYPTAIQRRPPSKFEFLHGSKSLDSDQPITSRLASELSQTLLRSNLKSTNDTSPDNTSTFRSNGDMKNRNSVTTINVNNCTAPQSSPPPGPSQIQMQHHHKALMKSQSATQMLTPAKVHKSNLTGASSSNRLTIRISDQHNS